MRNWVEVGDFPAQQAGGGQGIVGRGRFVPLSPILPSSLYFSIGTEFSLTILPFYLDFLCFYFFQGLDLLQMACLLQEELHEGWRRECNSWKQRGGERWRKPWQGQRQKVSMGSWGELHHSPTVSHLKLSLKKPCYAPSTIVSLPPPQESKGPEVSDPAGQATGPASPVAPSSLEEAIPAHVQPLQNQVGGIKWVYKCWVEGCKEGPSISWATICAHIRKVHLGVRLVCSLCGKTFFNPGHSQIPQKSYVN